MILPIQGRAHDSRKFLIHVAHAFIVVGPVERGDRAVGIGQAVAPEFDQRPGIIGLELGVELEGDGAPSCQASPA